MGRILLTFVTGKGLIVMEQKNIISLNLTGEGLVGSIPPEIAALGENLSNKRYVNKT